MDVKNNLEKQVSIIMYLPNNMRLSMCKACNLKYPRNAHNQEQF